MKMKNLLLAAIAVLSLSVLSGCRTNKPSSSERPDSSEIISSEPESSEPESSEPVSSEPTSTTTPNKGYEENVVHEDGVTMIDRVYGTKTSTTHTVDFYYNQPNKGIYRRYYVENGEKVTKFNLLISGLTFVGFFHDVYGVEEFDFKQAIESDMVVYAYHQGNGKSPEVYEYEETGLYKISWGRVKGASYANADGEVLPLSADLNAVVRFKLLSQPGTNKIFSVLINGKAVAPNEEGIYTVSINKNTKIVTTISGYEQRTYTVEANPEWLKSDGCQIFGWIWGPETTGEWIAADLVGTTFSFTTDKELSGFLFVRCVMGTTTPNWNLGSDSHAVGRIYNKTIDFICVPGRTVYNGSNAWVDYPGY